MKKVYFDNAATTPMRKQVINYMISSLKESLGNPSSIHSLGIKTRSNLEYSRINIANILNADPSEIIFTSSGTEANNLILRSCINDLKIKYIITSNIEHKSILETLNDLYIKYGVVIDFVKLNNNGILDINDLEKKLKKNNHSPILVSLMYVNNEIGNILDIYSVCNICKKYKAYFHSDTIQAIGHYNLDIKKLNIDFACGSAHKFNGPMGIGFAFIRKGLNIKAIITGGSQERETRAGTENIYGILGMSKAIEIANINLKKEKKDIENIKKYCIKQLKKSIPGIIFNGLSYSTIKSIYTILNIAIPKKDNMISFNLDLKGVIVSQGSACNSYKVSHVIQILFNNNKIKKLSFIRISFGFLNKKKDIDILISCLKDI
ncbi:Cysteine desulfurase [Candidatus Karelsulcia muelleri]|uniref:cysteine desulfurase n=1 Tax=Candidatus Karelsulcia muelleri TaxID=336810 RepID=A0A654M648_9FLAO|nr:cysteine desulfurase family protein [Candidatus Karelsulcia muelleri]AGS33380.1 Cysteine desulfurase [Candidatus Karelsulcia muelleri str. Sulcia-ALF]ALP70120.1 Cysteine desulfurase [Candidatus Karelsulcia muelleri]QND78366.1 Cysteine desulfurase [Candidatus Karelsulcia muelleri]